LHAGVAQPFNHPNRLTGSDIGCPLVANTD
jgi:hypothetical protein